MKTKVIHCRLTDLETNVNEFHKANQHTIIVTMTQSSYNPKREPEEVYVILTITYVYIGKEQTTDEAYNRQFIQTK
jgi:hypothetical protein